MHLMFWVLIYIRSHIGHKKWHFIIADHDMRGICMITNLTTKRYKPGGSVWARPGCTISRWRIRILQSEEPISSANVGTPTAENNPFLKDIYCLNPWQNPRCIGDRFAARTITPRWESRLGRRPSNNEFTWRNEFTLRRPPSNGTYP